MPRTITSGFATEKDKAAVSSINLYILQFDPSDSGTWRYYAERDTDVTFDGQIYTASSIKREDIEAKQDASIATTTVVVPDVTGAVWAYVLSSKSSGTLKSMRIVIRTVWANRLAEPTSYIEDTFRVVGAVKTWPAVTFELRSLVTFESMLPVGVWSKSFCRYRAFKGDLCKYAGAETTCNRTLNRCIALGNQANFGGQPLLKKKWA